jgi:hypothetical protein
VLAKFRSFNHTGILTDILLCCLFFAMQLLGIVGSDIASTLPPGLLSAAAHAWRAQAKVQIVSDTQSAVLSCLEYMGLRPKLEEMTKDGCFSLDITVEYRGQRVAVEVMGMEHYAVNPQYLQEDLLLLGNAGSSSSGGRRGSSSRSGSSGSTSGQFKEQEHSSLEEGSLTEQREGSREAQPQRRSVDMMSKDPVPYLLLLGPDCFRIQLVEARGWRVLPVSYVEVAQAEAQGYKALEDMLWQGLEQVTRTKGVDVSVGTGSSAARRGGRGGGRGRGRGRWQGQQEGAAGAGGVSFLRADPVLGRVELTKNVPKTVLDSLKSRSGHLRGPAANHLLRQKVKARSFEVGSLDWVSQQIKGLEHLALQDEVDDEEFDVGYMEEGVEAGAPSEEGAMGI